MSSADNDESWEARARRAEFDNTLLIARDEHATTTLEWCLAGWMTPGVGVGYRDLSNVYIALRNTPPPKWGEGQ